MIPDRFKYKPGHVPDLSTFNGVIDVFSLCIIMELGNILNGWSPATRAPGRHRLIYARKRCREIVDWICGTYDFPDKDGNKLDVKGDVYWPYLAQVARALYLHRVDREEDQSAESGSELRERIRGSLDHEPLLWEEFLGCENDQENHTFAWTGPSFTVVRHRREPLRLGKFSDFFFAINTEDPAQPPTLDLTATTCRLESQKKMWQLIKRVLTEIGARPLQNG